MRPRSFRHCVTNVCPVTSVTCFRSSGFTLGVNGCRTVKFLALPSTCFVAGSTNRTMTCKTSLLSISTYSYSKIPTSRIAVPLEGLGGRLRQVHGQHSAFDGRSLLHGKRAFGNGRGFGCGVRKAVDPVDDENRHDNWYENLTACNGGASAPHLMGPLFRWRRSLQGNDGNGPERSEDGGIWGPLQRDAPRTECQRARVTARARFIRSSCAVRGRFGPLRNPEPVLT